MLAHLNSEIEESKKNEKSILNEEYSTQISSSSPSQTYLNKTNENSSDEDCYQKNSICDEMFNMLQNDISQANRANECKLFRNYNYLSIDDNEKESLSLAYYDINFSGAFC